jgi:hypothetical protein
MVTIERYDQALQFCAGGIAMGSGMAVAGTAKNIAGLVCFHLLDYTQYVSKETCDSLWSAKLDVYSFVYSCVGLGVVVALIVTAVHINDEKRELRRRFTRLNC